MLSAVNLPKIKSTGKRFKVYDERGLYLEVQPTGAKWWRFKYRFQGKEKRLSVGVYPEVGLKEARDRRDEARKLLRDGIDPGVQRKAEKIASTNTFELVAREWFAKELPGWSESHSSRYLAMLERDILPWLGPKALPDITAPEILATIRRVEGRGALETAHRAVGMCGQVFRYGIVTGRCTRDPAADLRGALPAVQGEHFAATFEPIRLGSILRAMDGYSGSLVVKSALRLAPLVFVRPGELRKAEWKDFDISKEEWKYWVTKTKVWHIVPLCRQALEILAELHPLTGHGRYVFPGGRSTERPMSDNAVLMAMRALDIGADEMSGHGFRAVARTLLDEVLNFRTDIIDHQLAHKVKDPNGTAYNRTKHLVERKRMMAAWADYLDTLKATRSEVIEFRKRA